MEPVAFDLRLPPLELEAGGTVDVHLARGWWWGPASDLPALRARATLLPVPPPGEVIRRQRGEAPARGGRDGPALDPSVPTVLLVHALTGEAAADRWWGPLIGPGRVLDPQRMRLLCFNLLGSCYGSSGPADEDFPEGAQLTTWDQARSQLAALEALGIERIHLGAGGSLGSMVLLCLSSLAPRRFERLLPIAGGAASSAWVAGFNHVARQVVALDPGFPGDPARGLSLARQLAMLTYRAEPGLEMRQPRQAGGSLGEPFPIRSYLEHQGDKLVRRFDGRSYLALLDAMDHHDLARTSGGATSITASVLSVGIDSDQLFFPSQMAALAAALRGHARHVDEATLHSLHGHDAFLIEWELMDALIARALALPGEPS